MKQTALLFTLVLSIFFSVGASNAEADSSSSGALSCAVLPQLFNLYFRFHYVYHDMSDELRKRTIDQFVKTIDPSKTLLLESDVASIKSDLVGMFKTMDSDDCTKLDSTYATLLKRAEENEKIAKDFLGPNYKLDENTEVVMDPDKRKYPKDLEEKKAFLSKLIHFQITNYLLTKIKLDEAKKNLTHNYELTTKRIREKSLDKK